MNFESLVGHINQVQDVLQAQAAHLVTAIFPYLQENSQKMTGSDAFPIWRTLSAKLQKLVSQEDGILQTPSAKLEEWCTPPEKLFYRLNFSNLSYIASIDDPLKRAFYEHLKVG